MAERRAIILAHRGDERDRKRRIERDEAEHDLTCLRSMARSREGLPPARERSRLPSCVLAV
jgi:hypothetical protein